MNNEFSIMENEQDKSGRIELDNIQKSELAGHIETSWQMANGARVRWMRDKEEGLQLYWGIRRPKDFPFKNAANLHVPLIRTMTETLHANLMGSFDFDRPVSITPIGPEDASTARKAQKLLNWQFTTQVDYNDMLDKIISSCLIFGYAPVKVRYVVEYKNGIKSFDGLKIDILPPERFLMPPDAGDSSIQEMEYVMHEIPLSRSDINKRINAGMYDPIDKEELDRVAYERSKSTRQGDDFLENLRGLYSGVDSDFQASPVTKYGTIIEWYGNYDINKDGVDEPIMVSMLREAKKILRVVQWNDPVPFSVIKFSPILHRATGESVADILSRINQELNTLHNQRVDSVTLQNIPFFFFDPVAGFNPDEIKLSPGVGIPTNGPPSQAIYIPSLNISRPEMYKEEDILFEYAERLLGAGSNTQGIMESKRVTATEISTIDRRSGIRFLSIFNRIKKGIREILKIAIEMDKKYLPPEIQIRITGASSAKPIFEGMRRSDLAGQFDIAINGNSILDDAAEKQEMLRVYQIGMTNPIIMRDPQAIYEITRDLYLKLGVTRIDAYLREPEDEIPTSPTDEHNLFVQEEYIEPHLTENVDQHLRAHGEFINSETFKLLSKEGRLLAIRHYAASERMKNSIEQMQKIQQLSQINGAIHHMQMTGTLPPGAPGTSGPPGMPENPETPGIPGQEQMPGNPGPNQLGPGLKRQPRIQRPLPQRPMGNPQ